MYKAALNAFIIPMSDLKKDIQAEAKKYGLGK